MPLFPSLPTLSKKKQQQRRPTISHPLPSTASPHPLPSPHPSTPSLRSAGSTYTPSTPSTLNHSLPADTSPPPTPPLRPSSPLALPARTHASDKQRRSGGGVRYRDWLILPGRNALPRDGRDGGLPDEQPDHANADADAAPPATADKVEVMVKSEMKGFGVEGEVVAQVEEKVDLEVVDAFLEVALEDGNERVSRTRLARRRRGLKPRQPDLVDRDEADCFGGEEGVLRRDRRQGDIVRGSLAFRR